jgi:hypothetical protein
LQGSGARRTAVGNEPSTVKAQQPPAAAATDYAQQVECVKSLLRDYGVPLPTGHVHRLPDLLSKKPAEGLARCDRFVHALGVRDAVALSMAIFDSARVNREQRKRDQAAATREQRAPSSIFDAARMIREQHEPAQEPGAEPKQRGPSGVWLERRALVTYTDWLDWVAKEPGAGAAWLGEIPWRDRWRVVFKAIQGLVPFEKMDPKMVDFAVNAEWPDSVEKRLSDRAASFKDGIPVALSATRGMTLQKPGPQWDVANELLAGDDADSRFALGALFCHQFFALSGIRQPALTDGRAWLNERWQRGAEMATALLKLLKHPCEQLRETAGLVHSGLENLPLFCKSRACEASPYPQDDLVARLPDCFGPYDGQGILHAPDVAAMCKSDTSKKRAREALRLAAMAAAQLSSPAHLRASRGIAPGFTRSDVGYAYSLARYKPVNPYGKDMATLYKHLEALNFDGPQSAAPAGPDGVWPGKGANPCAMCFVGRCAEPKPATKEA